MKIEIIQSEDFKETEITIKAKYIDEELSEILACLSLIGNTVAGEKEGGSLMQNGKKSFQKFDLKIP